MLDEEKHAMASSQWDLTTMTFDEVRSLETLIFVSKVLLAACVVAFGPALVLEYVPTKKVDVGDITKAGSPPGRTQRLLLAFAGGGLMAEAALHLLPHLFLPHGGGDSHQHHEHHGLGRTCELIALGFLAAFAIDRFAGGKKRKKTGSGGPGHTTSVAESPAAAAAGAEDSARDVAGAAEGSTTAGALENDTGGAVAKSPNSVPFAATGSLEQTPAGGEDEVEKVVADGDVDNVVNDDSAADSTDVATEPAAYTADAAKATEPAADTADAAKAAASPTMEAVVAPGEMTVCNAASSLPAAETAPETDAAEADAEPEATAVATPSLEPATDQPELTLYGNPKTLETPETPEATASKENTHPPANGTDGETAPPPEESSGGTGASDGQVASAKAVDHDHPEHRKHDDHHEHHGDAEAGAYVTLAVDFLHNVIDGIGIGASYTLGGESMGHATAALKLIHEIQHEVGDVATLVQCGMSKHHAIHIQHTTAGGVFVGVAISLGASAFPAGLLTTFLALSAGATFHLASGTVLGPVLAIPAEVGGSFQGVLEVAALAAGAGGVVAVGLAEKWAGLTH